MRANAIGIDIGTTHCCVAVFKDGKVEIIPNEQGNQRTASYVAFTETVRLVGDEAKDQALENPCDTIFGIKHLIGRKFDDESVQNDMKHWPFKVISDENGKPRIQVYWNSKRKILTPEEVVSMILGKLKKIAEEYLGSTVKDAVISVPASFNDSQRRSTKDAATIAGLNVLRIINEPTCSAIANYYDNGSEDKLNVLVFDLGGGTVDISVLIIEDGIFEVSSTCGATNLGGEDFDSRLVNHFKDGFERKYRKDLSTDPKSLLRLRTACETAKCQLSSSEHADIFIENLFDGIDFYSSITRAHFEDLCDDIFVSSIRMKVLPLVLPSTELFLVVTVLRCCKIFCWSMWLIFLWVSIEISGGVFTPFIKKNSSIPTKTSQTITTHVNNQSGIKIPVFEGESAMTKDNILLGEFELTGIQSAPRGVPQIEVTFDVDANSILNVSAKDKNTGEVKKILITNDNGHLSKDEIERMILEAEKYNADDEYLKKKQVTKKNNISQLFKRVGGMTLRD